MDRAEIRAIFGDLRESYRRLNWQAQRMVFGAVFAAIIMTVIFWRFMIPVWLVAITVIIFLRRSRGEDSLWA